jgi:hypothetical protein
MPINTTQGHAFQKIRFFSPKFESNHGKLYVALLSVKSWHAMQIMR